MDKAINRFLWYTVFVLGWIICLYFILSMFFYWGYNLAILAIGLMMLDVSYMRLNNKTINLNALNKPTRIILIILLILGTAFVLLVEGLIISGTSKNEISSKADYLLILGGGIRGETVSKNLGNRLDKGLEYLELHPGTPVIVSGGQGNGESITEAEAMRRYLVAHGVSSSSIIMEDRSTSTYENFVFTGQVMDKSTQNGDITYAVVTSDFHMYRSRFLAGRNGFKVYSVPAPTPWYTMPNCYAREFFAVVKSYVFDI